MNGLTTLCLTTTTQFGDLVAFLLYALRQHAVFLPIYIYDENRPPYYLMMLSPGITSLVTSTRGSFFSNPLKDRSMGCTQEIGLSCVMDLSTNTDFKHISLSPVLGCWRSRLHCHVRTGRRKSSKTCILQDKLHPALSLSPNQPARIIAF